MKLHWNRKKRNNVKRLISLALVCCMTFSMGSSYVTAGEWNMPAADGGAAVPSMGGVEAVSVEPQEAGDPDISIEGTPSDNEQEPAGIPEEADVPETAEVPEETDAPQASEETDAPESAEVPEETDATEAPEETDAPETTEAPEETDAPEATEAPEETDAPESTEVPEETDAPEATEAPEETDVPETTETPVPEDYSGLMSIYELAMQPLETVGATLSLEDGVTQNAIGDNGWSFDTYYVNESDRYNVTKTDDFSLKYQMEFHASRTFEAGAIKIKIDGALLSYRDNGAASPSDIGVPATKWDEEGKPAANPSRSTSFNYYYENADGTKSGGSYSPETPYLVFYNYKAIPSGTNAAWQVLYSNLKIMDIKDETAWSRKPQVFIDGRQSAKEMNAFSGRVNSSVSLTGVVKTPFYESGKKYTPGLYTLNQLQKYVSSPIANDYIKDGKLNTQDYKFVVWDVKITGKATQPWNLYIQDVPSAKTEEGTVNGKVVGYKDHSDSNTTYNFPITVSNAPAGAESKASSSDQAGTSALKRAWGHRFWVVTAYPADSVLPGDEAVNDMTVRLEPQDDSDPDEILAATPASWSYRDYDWRYDGDVIRADKWNGWSGRDDTTVYTGWLEAYRRASQKGEDYGDIPFTVTGDMKGYGMTHHVGGAQLGEYIEGTSYRLITADDFLYVMDAQGNPKPMGEEDYYFSSVTVNQRDHGYDIYDDKLVASELSGLKEAGKISDELSTECETVKIYAMFAENPDTWELVASVPMTSGNVDYTFTPEQIAREPYRVKAEHETIDYSTECTIKLAVRLKAESAQSGVMKDIIEARGNADIYGSSEAIRLENLSGVMGIQTGSDGGKVVICDSGAEDGVSSETSFNYGDRAELAEKTEELYDCRLVRENAVRTVTWLETTAQANKKYSAKNDAENNRVLVDYYLTAYDGYLIYDKSCLDYMSKTDEELMSPGRKHVVFYDLLPYGMQFDASTPVTAGRIKDLDAKGSYTESPRSWDGTQVSVTVDPAKDITTNYKGTGRTMVAFHISYSGADPAVYTNGKWVEGWGVTFRAYYEWKNMDSINKVANANLAAFMPDFSVEDQINQNNPVLYGQRNQVYADDGEMSDAQEAEIYKDLLSGDGKPGHKGNIDGNAKYDQAADGTWNRNVLYAKETVNDDVATSSESSIQKLVRADSDPYGAFRESAMIAAGDGYTYEITVSAKENSAVEGIAVFDCLESAAPSGQQSWQGLFRGVDLSALTKQGISATVYYNTERNARIPVDGENPAEILTEENGWYLLEEETDTDSVKAVAVLFDADYKLPQLQSASFRIQMKAPDNVEKGTYAYNNASFSSYPEGGEEQRKTVPSESARVGVNEQEKLEIVKRTSGVVPTALQNTEFSFQVYEEDAEGNKEKLAFLAYDLYRADRDGSWHIQNSQPHATDENGYLYLKANEKAVFHVVDADRIMVEETANVFWDANPASGQDAKDREERYTETVGEDGETVRKKDPQGRIHVRTWTNTFRPVVYVQKKLAAVPQGVTVEDAAFTFKLWVKKGTEYVPAANSAFWYVDSILTDGGIPGRVNQNGEPWTEQNGQADQKKTNADGTFTIKPGQIIALFPGLSGTEYKITEENLDNGYIGDWYCSNPEVKGTVVPEGSSRTITNYYRWKELNLTKEITHQDASECRQAFTFRITELELDEKGSPKTDEDGNAIEVKDADGKVSTAGLKWELLDAQSGETSDDSGITGPTSGTLDDEGKFSCAFAGRTVRISGLEAGKYYLVKEMPVDRDEVENEILYQPVKDSEEFKMLPTSTKKDLTFVNDYLKRPLTVKKTVTGADDENVNNVDFEFTIRVNGRLLPSGIQYTVTEQGNVVAEGTTEDGGKFHLKDGQEVTFQDAGLLGQSFEVTETETEDQEYVQLYPANGEPAEGTLTGEGGKASFVNGTANALYISKEYVTKEGEDSFAGKLKGSWETEVEGLKPTSIYRGPYEYETEFILEVTDETGTYIWPKEDTLISGMNQLNTMTITRYWEAGKSIMLPPWVVFSIPVGDGSGEIPENASYTLTEAESSQKRMVKVKNKDTDIAPPIDGGGVLQSGGGGLAQLSVGYGLTGSSQENRTEAESGYVQITQSYPADFGSIKGTVESAPTATIVNELTSLDGFSGSKVGKRMTAASSEVPTGKKLVWRVEKYDTATMTWSPAEGISYAVFKDDESPISTEVQTTGADGKILLEKPERGYPEVWFVRDAVYIDLYNQSIINRLAHTISNSTSGTVTGNEERKTLLRLVEVPEESGKEWGLLAGYQASFSEGDLSWDIQNPQDNEQAQTYPRIAVDPTYKDSVTAYFCNSNSKSSIEIEKYTEKPSYQEFTMILKQVMGITDSSKIEDINSSNYGLMVTEPRGGIEYTIHNVDGSEVKGPKNGVTGPGGEITLRAGQYVILDVPDGTVWTVSEDTYAAQNYELTNLAPESNSGKLVKLTDNLMLVNLSAPLTRYTLRFDPNGGTGGPGAMAQDSQEFTIPDEVPIRDGYAFKGWGMTKSGTDVTYEAGGTIYLLRGNPTVTLYAVWEKEQIGMVTYKDTWNGMECNMALDIEGSPFFKDGSFTARTVEEAYNGFLSDTSAIDILKKRQEERHEFLGWSVLEKNGEIGKTVYQPGDKIQTDGQDVTLCPVWKIWLPLKVEVQGIQANQVPANARIEGKLTYTLAGKEYEVTIPTAKIRDIRNYCYPKVDGVECKYSFEMKNLGSAGYNSEILYDYENSTVNGNTITTTLGADFTGERTIINVYTPKQ